MGMRPFHDGERDSPRPFNSLLFKQRLSVFFFCWSVMGIIWSWMLVVLLVRLSSVLAAAVFCYLAYAWTVGWQAAENMSWEPKLRRWSLWRLMRDYFKAELHKTTDLSPENTYIFAMVPHGITAVSGWLTFATSTTGFETKFPGINVRALTLDANFLAPGIREYCLLSGLRSCGRKSFRNILGSGPGSAVLLVPGGAAEAFLAAPGTCDLLTAKRKGFVRMAIETGAHLVPVVAFGENEMFETFIPPPGSVSARLLFLIKKFTGLACPIFWGTGFTEGSWGILPKGVKLDTVVGAPIEVPRYVSQGHNDAKMAALVDDYHARFLAAIQKIWDEHAPRFCPKSQRCLMFVK